MIGFCSEASEFLPAPLGFWGNTGHGASSVILEVAQFGTSGAARTGSQPRSLGNVNYETDCKLLHLVSVGIRKDKEWPDCNMAIVSSMHHPFTYQVGLLSSLTPRRSSHCSLPAAAPTTALSEKPALLRNLEAILRPEVPAMQIKVVLYILFWKITTIQLISQLFTSHCNCSLYATHHL